MKTHKSTHKYPEVNESNKAFEGNFLMEKVITDFSGGGDGSGFGSGDG